MAKNSIRDYSATNSSNTDIQSIDISEGCSPAGINNAIREVMADLKDVSTGAVALESPAADSLSVTGDLTVDTNTLYVDSTNNRVGIGTSSPQAKMQVLDQLKVSSADQSAGSVVLGDGSSTSFNVGIARWNGSTNSAGAGGVGYFSQGSVNVGGHFFYTGDAAAGSTTERMQITSSGNLCIGNSVANTASGYNNQPGGGYVASDSHFEFATTANRAAVEIGKNNANDGQLVAFRKQGTVVGEISVTGSSTSYNTSSDYRLKTAVNYDWDATTRLKQLKPARFEWIVDGDDAVPVDGFLAHEVQDIVPESITGTKDAMRDEEYQVSAATGDIYTPAIEAVLDEDGNEVTPAVAEVIHSTDVERPEELAEGQQWRETTAAVMGTRSVPDYQGIDQSKLVPLLVKTIQELEARIAALEAN